MSARSSLYEKRILLTKPFQARQSWHQLSVYENKILVQKCLLNEWTLDTIGVSEIIIWCLIFKKKPFQFLRKIWIIKIIATEPGSCLKGIQKGIQNGVQKRIKKEIKKGIKNCTWQLSEDSNLAIAKHSWEPWGCFHQAKTV